MNISAIGNILTDLSSSIEKFREIIQKLDTILDKEFDAVGRSELHELESITAEKVLCSQSMEEMVRYLNDKFQKIGLELGFKQTFVESQIGMNLEEMLTDIYQSMEQKNLSVLFNETLEAIRYQHSLLKSERQRVFPKVESNSYLIRKLLQYHRETYAFWQAVAGESEAVYGSSGKAKAVTQRSILSVRT